MSSDDLNKHAEAFFSKQEKKTFLNNAWYVAPLVGQAADTVTTYAALKTGRFEEGNPAMQGLVAKVPLFLAIKVGVGLGMGFAVRTLARSGHKNAAKIISVVGTGLGLGPAISNVMQMRGFTR